MTNLELAKQQGNQAAPNVLDAAKASEVQIDTTLAQEQGNQATPLIADSLAGSESYDAIKQQGNQAMPLIADALVRPTPAGSPMYFEAAEANSTVSMVSMLGTAPNLEYSTDGVTWQEWQHTTSDGMHTFDTLTLTDVGDRVYLRGDNPNGLAALPEDHEEDPDASNFRLTGAVKGGGNIMSLLDADMELTDVPMLGFFMLFSVFDGDEPALITAPSMETITTVSNGGCASMYNGCTSLTVAADMSSLTTISNGGCSLMYAACSLLTAAANMPLLTAIGDDGCASMYNGCTSLTVAADMHVLTTIGGYGCASMYSGCSLLTGAADMPSLTTIDFFGCDSMYSDCTSLTAAADMSSLITISRRGCANMYLGCTSLTVAADMHVLTTIGGYGCFGMYAGCTSLTAAADMPSLTAISDGGCDSMYKDCTFDMSDDNMTLNFDFPTPPVMAGETTYETAPSVAAWMGNLNGFVAD